MITKWITIFTFFSAALLASQCQEFFLDGYLGEERMQEIEESLHTDVDQRDKPLLFTLHSSAGEIDGMLSLAQKVYALKKETGREVITYIQGKAIGPAAILPFLADKIFTTPLAAWGDIPYGTENFTLHKKLSSTVQGLINKDKESAAALHQLADAMVDPSYQLANETQGFAPLILNVKGLQSLNLVDKVMSDEEFENSYLSGNMPESSFPSTSSATTKSELDNNLKKHISYKKEGENLIGWIYLASDKTIDQSTYIDVKYSLDDFKKKGVSFVILHLNTPGGEVLSSIKIAKLLQKSDIKDGIPIIAFIDDWAISAGAMLAYSCRFISVTPGSIMGAAEPILVGKDGKMETASEKVNSALRAEFASLANFYGRNPLIAEAMVDKDKVLVVRNHNIVELRSNEEIIHSGPDPDTVITEKGKLLTLKSDEMLKLGVADFEVPAKNSFSIEDVRNPKPKWPGKNSLVFTQPYLAEIPNAYLISYGDWRIKLFTILSHPVISSLLLVGLILGLYIEINTPGFGFPGAIALFCLGLILISSFATQAFDWIEIILLLAGLALLALELFVIPGFGITGILGIVLIIIGLFALMLPGLNEVNLFNLDALQLVGESLIKRLAYLSSALVISAVLIFLLSKIFSKTFFNFSKLVLMGEQEAKEGYVAGIPKEMMPLEGDIGETLCPLRPSGKIRIGDKVHDAISQGGYIEAKILIEVVKIEGSKAVVRILKEEIK